MAHLVVNRPNIFANRGSAVIIGKADWAGDWQGRYMPGADADHVQAYAIDGATETTPGLFYVMSLAGSQGADFLLFAEPDMSQGAVDDAKRFIYRTGDVVTLRVFRITRWQNDD
jgi:hypothetical protein